MSDLDAAMAKFPPEPDGMPDTPLATAALHPEVEDQLAAYTAGELAGAECDALDRHLAACATCRAALAETRRIRALLAPLQGAGGHAALTGGVMGASGPPSLAGVVLARLVASAADASGAVPGDLAPGAGRADGAIGAAAPLVRPVSSVGGVSHPDVRGRPPLGHVGPTGIRWRWRGGHGTEYVRMERQTTRVAATIAPAPRPSGTNSPTHARATFTRRPRAAAAPAIAATVAIILVSALLFGVLGRFQRGGHGLTPGGQPGAAVTTPTGTAPTPTPGATGPAGTLHGLITDIAMMPSGDGWAVGSLLSSQGTIVLLRYHAGQWTPATLPIAGVRLVGIAMDSASDGWAVGSRADASPVGILLHYANGRWVQAPETFPGVDLGGVSMDSATDGWAIGTDPNATFGGLVLHFDGARWRQVSIPGATFAGVMVRALAPDNVWVVGNVGKERSVILHYDGSAWVATPLPDHVGFIGEIAMLSADEGWAVGLNNVILRYHAGAWTVVATVPQGAQPLAIAMASGTDGWVAGFNNPSPAGVFLEHYDGHTWSLVAGPRQVGPTDIVALTVTTDGEVWAGGHAETSGGQVPILLRFANGRWRAVPIP